MAAPQGSQVEGDGLTHRQRRIPAPTLVPAAVGAGGPGRAECYTDGVGAELAVVVTVAAIFLVPAALGRAESEGSFWPRGDLGNALDGALMLALVVMAVWVAVLLFGAL